MKINYLFIFLISSASFLSAQLSPGDLSEPHRHLDGLKNCTKCHEIGEKVQPSKCLDCHSLLNDLIRNGIGLHSRSGYENCLECHSDHQGREFNMIWWNKGVNNFDHSKTGYILEGKHLNLDCRQCHNSKNIVHHDIYLSEKKDLNRTYFGLDKKCTSCHLDEHRGQLGTDCLKCHTIDGWTPALQFDHNQTRFPLSGKHQSVKCNLCHKSIEDRSDTRDESYLKFSGLNFSQCSDCHRDPHSGRLGSSCKKCHSVSGWKGIVSKDFNHEKTRFPLIGKHQNVPCERCHRPNQSLTKLKFKNCLDCHHDFHQGQFKPRPQKGECDECHSVNGFVPANFSIEQHNSGNYPLTGAHLAVPCNLCHLRRSNNMIRFRFSSTTCQTCHRDPHNQESEVYVKKKSISDVNDGCRYCHTVDGWASIEFDHTQTNFVLTGKHQFLTCKSCHQNNRPDPDNSVLLKLNKNECQDCHQDIHNGQFQSKDKIENNNPNSVLCNKCHTTDNWVASKFDHDLHSRFKLEGAHKRLTCSQCHKTVNENGSIYVKYKSMDMSCSACHIKRSMAQ